MSLHPTNPKITLLGLGPGEAELLTRQAWQVIENCGEIWLRTSQHPLVASFPAEITVRSFDHLYESQADFSEVYREIVEQVLALSRRPQGVVYAVPGHPFVAEATGPEIARRARQENIPLRVVEGLSFLEPVFTALGQDPLPQTALVDALEVALLHYPNFPPTSPAIIAQVYSREVASEVKLTLNALYPDEHPVFLVHAAGSPGQVVESLKLYEIDRSRKIGLLTALYVPPLDAFSSFESFQEVIARLRAPDGCPWDREQTHLSLRRYLIEETYEVIDALDAEDPQALAEELGDLLLQVGLHAQIAAEAGDFNMSHILRGINQKLVRRHPHVFGDIKVEDAQGVLQNWEKLKAEERQGKGKAEASLLDGVSQALPALVQAEQYQLRAARVGFDWPDISGVLEKVLEEVQEIKDANDQERAGEIGDLLFALVNLARWYRVDAESALRGCNARFKQRFAYIEAWARQHERSLSEMTLPEMDELWEQAKGQESAGAG